MSQGSCSCIGVCAATRVGWEVIVGITVHDKVSNLTQRGVDNGKLIHELRDRFGTICRQEGINDSEVGGMVEFKFKRCYKIPRASHEATLGCLRIQQFKSIKHCVLLPPLTVDMMTAAKTRV